MKEKVLDSPQCALFPAMCSGSSVWAEYKLLDQFHNLQSFIEPEKIMKTELENISYLGETKCSYLANKLSAHFELHIDQASVLEKTAKKIGVVTGIQGMSWFHITISGADGHAGSSPMPTRKDAMVAAAKLILHVDEIAQKVEGFGTVGCLKPASSAPNTIVGSVECIVDFRHPSDATLDEIEKSIQELLKTLETDTPGLSSTFRVSWSNKSIEFNQQAINCVERAADLVCGEQHVRMISRAAHDRCELLYFAKSAT